MVKFIQYVMHAFIKEQTLLDVKRDSALFSNIAMYLRKVCNVLVDSVKSLRNMAFATPVLWNKYEISNEFKFLFEFILY